MGIKLLFMLCNSCNRLAHQSPVNVWHVDHSNCRCIFLKSNH